ncbi:MAG: NAD-dependent deacylase [Chitinophagaceae bacterium]|nr:MAG: NAD-dependent deacylase [Chitinophagaceae bacterium]
MKKKMVVLTGAGISAESGLRTFRDSDGLWEGYEVTEVATPRAWKKNPSLVLDFYNMRRRDVAAATPNAAHAGLAELEKLVDLTIVTQNIDDLHERAGSSKVMHLHGSIFRMRSDDDEETLYEIRDDMMPGDKAPDGSFLRPAIVWFEEAVPMIGMASAVIEEADLFAIVGTSLVVYPAAGLIHYTRPGIPLFIVDKKLPDVRLNNLVRIEKPATEGVQELVQLVKAIVGEMES